MTVKIYMDLDKHIKRVMKAHSRYVKTKKDGLRYWDKKTPYLIHPIWCAMTLLTETGLNEKLRWGGAIALLYHDVIEDTEYKMPKDLNKNVLRLVEEMTFVGGFNQEKKELLFKDKEVLLLKLYDKTSTLLDNVWMKRKQSAEFRDLVRKILKITEKEYGELNIVRIAKGILR